MLDQLAELLGGMAVHIAHERGWSIAEAAQYVKRRATDLHEEHRQAGAPYGNADTGFVRWLTTLRGQVTPSAQGTAGESRCWRWYERHWVAR